MNYVALHMEGMEEIRAELVGSNETITEMEPEVGSADGIRDLLCWSQNLNGDASGSQVSSNIYFFQWKLELAWHGR